MDSAQMRFLYPTNKYSLEEREGKRELFDVWASIEFDSIKYSEDDVQCFGARFFFFFTPFRMGLFGWNLNRKFLAEYDHSLRLDDVRRWCRDDGRTFITSVSTLSFVYTIYFNINNGGVSRILKLHFVSLFSCFTSAGTVALTSVFFFLGIAPI